MERHQIETIDDLLKYNGYPSAYIGGHHTRIIEDRDGTFETLGQEPLYGRYTDVLYQGKEETAAVWAFIENEDK